MASERDDRFIALYELKFILENRKELLDTVNKNRDIMQPTIKLTIEEETLLLTEIIVDIEAYIEAMG